MKTNLFFTISCILLSISIATAHSGDTVIVPQGTIPVIDGVLSSGEWDDASTITFNASGINITCHFKYNGNTLYIAQSVPNLTDGDKAFLLFDVNHNGGSLPQIDDYWFYKYYYNATSWLRRTAETKGTGTSWEGDCLFDWLPPYDSLSQCGWYAPSGWWASSTGVSWTNNPGQVEFNISFSKLNIIQGTSKTLGFLIGYGEFGSAWFWPQGNNNNNPNTWADMVISFTTSIKEKANNNDAIIIFPNPAANDRVFIELPDYKNTTIEIANIQGQIIENLSVTNTKTTIDLSKLSGGVYLIKVKTDKGIIIKKLIKQ